MTFCPNLLTVDDLNFVEIVHPFEHDGQHFLAFSFDVHKRWFFISATMFALVDQVVPNVDYLFILLVCFGTLITDSFLVGVRVEIKST